jgi:hypothetical protein
MRSLTVVDASADARISVSRGNAHDLGVADAVLAT